MTNEMNTVQVGRRGVALGWVLVAMMAWICMAVYTMAAGVGFGM